MAANPVRDGIPGLSACVTLLRETRALQKRMEAALAPLDLSVREYEIMRCIAEEALSQSAIAARLNSDKVMVSRGVAKLVRKTWASRRHPPADKRILTVSLTDQGRSALRDADRCIRRLLPELNEGTGSHSRARKPAPPMGLRRSA